jgi:hypothetical protein
MQLSLKNQTIFITNNVPLILIAWKVFFMRAKLVIGNFEGFFEWAETFLNLASHTWFSLHAAIIIIHNDPQLSQGLTADEKSAPPRNSMNFGGTKFRKSFTLKKVPFGQNGSALEWYHWI